MFRPPRPGHHKDRLSTHPSFYRWRDGLSFPECSQSQNVAACECRRCRSVSKGPLAMHSLPTLGNTKRSCGYAPLCVACRGSHHPGGCPIPREQPQCCGCGGNYTANYWGCVNWKEAKAVPANNTRERAHKKVAKRHPAASKAQRAVLSVE